MKGAAEFQKESKFPVGTKEDAEGLPGGHRPAAIVGEVTEKEPLKILVE